MSKHFLGWRWYAGGCSSVSGLVFLMAACGSKRERRSIIVANCIPYPAASNSRCLNLYSPICICDVEVARDAAGSVLRLLLVMTLHIVYRGL